MAEAAEPETASVGRMPDVSVFHSEDFDPIDFCNRLFPTDSSLERLPDAMNAIQKQIDDIDARILQTVRDQSSSSGRARADLAFVQEAVKQLFGKMEGIQEKAQETEGLVNTICKDITRLDQAKSNLTISISGLRRLAMLIDAVDQLKAQVGRSGVKRMDFKQVAAMLGAAGTLVEEFQDHANIPQVMELCSDFKALRKQVETMVLAEFKGSWMTHDISEDEKKDIPDYEQWMEDIHGEKFRKMEECCGIVAVLGTDMRAAVMNDITTKELELYSAMKPLLTGISKHKKPLDENMQSRYQWFLDRMTAPLFRRQWAVFPRSWRMRQDMSMRFCKVVRAQLGELLDQAANDATLDVATLIKTVSLTQRFEQLLERLMAASVHHRWTSGGHSLLDDEGPSEEQRRVMAAEERLRTYAKANRPATAAADGSGPFPDDEDDGEPMQFVGVVSSAFQGHLNLYLRQAESELYDTLGKLILDEHGCGWTSPDPLSHILSSANLLLTAIRDAATRCKKGLGSGKALQELSVVFDKVLGSYAQELTKQLCKPSSGVIPSGTALLALKDSDWQVTASNETLVIACHIVHTGVFCDSKCQDLQRWLQQLTQPPWSQDINLAQSQKAFQAVINSAVQVLALAVATRLEGALSELKAFKWDIGDAPEDGQDHLQGSGFSPFVQQAQTVLRESAAVLKAHLHSMRGTDGGEQDGGGSDDGGDEDDGIDDYYWVVCGRAVTMFGPRLEDAVLKCRRISSAGSQQLYQDVQTVQTELAAFPRLSNWASDPGYAEFTQTLRSMLYPAVNLAKVIQMSSTAELMLETWKSLMPLEKQNVADLKALLDLLHDTHMTKAAKNDLLTQYGRMLEGLPAPSISRPPPPRPSPAGTTASTTAAEPTALAMASSSTAGPDAASGRFSSSRFMPRMGLPGSWSSRSTPGLSHLKSAAASVGHGGSVAGEKVASLGAKMTRGTRDGLSSLGSGLSSTSRALGARMASSIPFRGGGGTGSGPAGSAGG